MGKVGEFRNGKRSPATEQVCRIRSLQIEVDGSRRREIIERDEETEGCRANGQACHIVG
jgi:hypothetical protein